MLSISSLEKHAQSFRTALLLEAELELLEVGHFFAWKKLFSSGLENVRRLWLVRLSLDTVLHAHNLRILQITYLLLQLLEVRSSRLWKNLRKRHLFLYAWSNQTFLMLTGSPITLFRSIFIALSSLIIGLCFGRIAILDFPKVASHNTIFIIKFIISAHPRTQPRSSRWRLATIYGPQDNRSPTPRPRFANSISNRCARFLVGSRNPLEREGFCCLRIWKQINFIAHCLNEWKKYVRWQNSYVSFHFRFLHCIHRRQRFGFSWEEPIHCSSKAQIILGVRWWDQLQSTNWHECCTLQVCCCFPQRHEHLRIWVNCHFR